jgi:hypothetical protein
MGLIRNMVHKEKSLACKVVFFLLSFHFLPSFFGRSKKLVFIWLLHHSSWSLLYYFYKFTCFHMQACYKYFQI